MFHGTGRSPRFIDQFVEHTIRRRLAIPVDWVDETPYAYLL
jgi:hypothetical protein